jgi:hypothetical protein
LIVCKAAQHFRPDFSVVRQFHFATGVDRLAGQTDSV